MNYPVTPKPPDSGNTAISILRVFLWLLPAVLLFVGILFAIGLDEKWPILLIPGLAATAGLGYFDRRLYLQQRRLEANPYKKETIIWTVAFVLMQTIIAPAVCFSVIYGICMVTDSGFH